MSASRLIKRFKDKYRRGAFLQEIPKTAPRGKIKKGWWKVNEYRLSIGAQATYKLLESYCKISWNIYFTFITFSKLKGLLGVTYPTLKKYIDELQSKDVIKIIKFEKYYIYFLHKDFHLFGHNEEKSIKKYTELIIKYFINEECKEAEEYKNWLKNRPLKKLV